MKKSMLFSAVLAALLVFSAPAALFSLDWGVSIDNSSTVKFGGTLDDPELVQRNKAVLWTESSWTGQNGEIYTFSAQGSYLYTNDRPYLFDVDRLVLRSRQPSLFGEGTVLDFALGRFRFRETTGLVLNHPADGWSVALDHGFFRWNFAAGHTAMLLKPESGIQMSTADAADKADDSVKFAPNRLIQITEVSFPRLIPRQLVTVSLVTQKDMRAAGERDSFHGTASMAGPAAAGLYYSASGTYGHDLTAAQGSLMGSADLRYFREDWFFSRFALGALYAGENFFTISTPPLGLVHTPELNDLFRVSLDYSMRPWGNRMSPAVRNLQFTAGGKVFLVPSEGYSGTEVEGGINFRPASDFGASLKGGLFFPNTGEMSGLVRAELSAGF